MGSTRFSFLQIAANGVTQIIHTQEGGFKGVILPTSLLFSLLLAVFAYAVGLVSVWHLRGRARQIAVWAIPLVWLAFILFVGAQVSPLTRLIFSTVTLLGLIKCAAALKRPRDEIRAFSRLGLPLYFTIWPGVELRAFAARVPHRDDERQWAHSLFRGAGCFVAGAALLIAIAWNLPELSFDAATWGTFAALLLLVHFGIGAMLPWLVRQIGFAVGPLFRAPERAESLADFWSKRWNLPFVEMDRLLFLRPLRKRLGGRGALLGVFVVSGILHELGISYPALQGWGGPLLYFIIQGVLVAFIEPRLPIALRRIGAWLAILVPLPLLFHAPFRAQLVWPLVQYLNGSLHLRSFDWYFSLALWLGALGHFTILLASFQVPKQLNWHEDLAKLSRFNRKVFWTYGGFIVGCIVAFGVIALVLHDEYLRGDKAAVAIALFNGAFWIARVGTDFFYFGDEDWPRGALFEIGHVALTLLFCALAVLFGVVVPLRAWL